MSSEMERAIDTERARCLGLVEGYRSWFVGGYGSMLVTRLANIIRNGTVPETFTDQLASEDPTEYSEPTTVAEERERCLQCLRIHYDENAPLDIKRMLLELEQAIDDA